MSELLNHVEESIRARGLLGAGQGIVVAVSGGLDSMVLLHVLHELAPRHGWRLTVAHLNHRLRGQSSTADERLVRRTAKALRVPVVVERAEVRRLARAEKVSIEMAARRRRHDFLARVAWQRRARVALAHHADDQVELFFLRLLRGSGGRALAGMKWRSPSPADARVELVRPLLDQSKTALAQYASERGIQYREDASNTLLDFQRNRVRHELLPLLRKHYQPALDRTIARVIDIVGEEAELADQLAREWVLENLGPSARAERRGGRAPFEDLPVAVQRRCVQQQLRGLEIEPEYELVERLRVGAGQAVAVSRPGERRAPRCVVRDRHGLLRLQAAKQEEFRAESQRLELRGRAGETEFGDTRVRWRISSRAPGGAVKGAVRRECFDADRVGAVVELRHWQPGDRFQPIGMPGAVKLQDFFTNRKVPRDERRRLLVAATVRGQVFWVEGMRISEQFKLTERTKRCLQWCWKRV